MTQKTGANVLHAGALGLVPLNHLVPWALPGTTSKHRARRRPLQYCWVWPPNKIKQKKNILMMPVVSWMPEMIMKIILIAAITIEVLLMLWCSSQYSCLTAAAEWCKLARTESPLSTVSETYSKWMTEPWFSSTTPKVHPFSVTEAFSPQAEGLNATQVSRWISRRKVFTLHNGRPDWLQMQMTQKLNKGFPAALTQKCFSAPTCPYPHPQKNPLH